MDKVWKPQVKLYIEKYICSCNHLNLLLYFWLLAGSTPDHRLPLALNYMPVLWWHGSSWDFCWRCSGPIQRAFGARECLWVQNNPMWFLRAICHAEGDGHPPSCCPSKELIRNLLFCLCVLDLLEFVWSLFIRLVAENISSAATCSVELNGIALTLVYCCMNY